MRSDRLLLGMQKVFGHDLPNQMVVMQSLLHLIAEEEWARLSDDGREYVRRLQSAARRAGDMVRFLKEMARLNALSPQDETITLAALARQLQGELQQHHSTTRFEFAWHWHVPAIVGDSGVFLQGILELCAGLLSPRSVRCRLSAISEESGDTTELTFRLQEPRETTPTRCTMQTLEQRMEIVLAREWLALCGAVVELNLAAEAGTCFCIVVPNR